MNEERYNWQENAACRGIEPEIFFPVSDEEAGPAKAICGACEARSECLLPQLGIRMSVELGEECRHCRRHMYKVPHGKRLSATL